jgi:SARP family transcriptional regulator, regulator of embCAB operon
MSETPVSIETAYRALGAHLAAQDESFDVSVGLARFMTRADRHESGVELRLLGRVTLLRHDREIVLAAKARQILTLLALRADTVVRTDEIVEELWGDSPPLDSRRAVQTYLGRVHHIVRAAAEKPFVAPREGGYVLESRYCRVDVLEFERLAVRGDEAWRTRDFAVASRLFTEALALWSGPALTGVRIGRRLAGEVEAAEEARLLVLDRRIGADLQLGRHEELLEELTGLVDRHPTHEGLRAHLMEALRHSGRGVEATEETGRAPRCTPRP